MKLATEPGLKPAYNQLTHQIRTGINSDYENWCNKNCDELEQLQKTHQTHGLHKKIKELTCGIKIADKSTSIKDKNGRLLTDVHDVRNRWAEYCSELYNHDTKPDNTVLTGLWNNQQQEPMPDISVSESCCCCQETKTKESARNRWCMWRTNTVWR